MEFKYPFVLYIGPLLLLLFWYIFSKKGWGKRYAVHSWVSRGKVKKAGLFKRGMLKASSFFVLMSVLSNFVALAYPLGKIEKEEIRESVHRMVLLLDVSGSMYGKKLEAVTAIAQDLVRSRKGDLIGIVPFDDKVVKEWVVPLTTDTEYLVYALQKISSYSGTSTSIGEGLLKGATELYKSSGVFVDADRLRAGIQNKQEWGSYVSHVIQLLRGMENCFVVVLTDSGNNDGIDPISVLKLYQMSRIKAYGVRIGVVNDKMFQKAIRSTGGRAYRAENMADVARFFQEIDKIEKKEEIVDIRYYKKPQYEYFLLVSLICLLLSFLLRLFVILHV